MEDRIEIKFDKRLNGYVVTMPDFVTFKMIEEWKERFDKVLTTIPDVNKLALLVDTNRHNFESIQCLKSLRDYFTSHTVLKSNFLRVAFVAPANFMEPVVKSWVEAYFDSFELAYRWLEE